MQGRNQAPGYALWKPEHLPCSCWPVRMAGGDFSTVTSRLPRVFCCCSASLLAPAQASRLQPLLLLVCIKWEGSTMLVPDSAQELVGSKAGPGHPKQLSQCFRASESLPSFGVGRAL